jgi:hypothetical protein
MASRKIPACGLVFASFLFLLPTGNVRAQEPTTPQQADLGISDTGPDPALANMAPVDAGSPEQQADADADASQYPQAQPADGMQPSADSNDANSLVDTESDQPPPDLFDYDQPFSPGALYLWTPGYWAHSPVGFFWVPGQWTIAPFYGALWTPPYWGFNGGRYLFHGGYWGTHVGFYGGVNYGFGYIGTGYFGGFWRDHDFYYNRAVSRVDPATVATVYSHTVVYHGVTYGPGITRYTSYNGGHGGLKVRPVPTELVAARETHLPENPGQAVRRRLEANNAESYFSANQGHPRMAAFVRPAVATSSSGNSAISRIPIRVSTPAETIEKALHRREVGQETIHRLTQERAVDRAPLLQQSPLTRQERIEAVHQRIEDHNSPQQSATGVSSEATTMRRVDSQPGTRPAESASSASLETSRRVGSTGVSPSAIHHMPGSGQPHTMGLPHPIEPAHSAEHPVEQPQPGEEPHHTPAEPPHSAPVTPAKPIAPRPAPPRPR